MTESSGKSYERQVMRHLTERDKTHFFELDVRVPARGTGHLRQIDVWLPSSREIIECKHHGRPADVNVVDSLIGKMDDVGALGGRIFSHSGFSRNATARADKFGIAWEALPFEESTDTYPERSGAGHYAGDYVDLCLASTTDCDTFGRVSYDDGDGGDAPLCVGHSVDWHNRTMHGFIAHVIMSHYLGKPPAEESVAFFLDAFAPRFEAGYEWHIDEAEVSQVAFTSAR
ncbi:restriction endonuclease [Streptomyces sp. NPDC127072]|uniref:restriction endonuclease n=1 Tax=Streptomyces sp. NPDC127072 TaxID=3347129 RepID=UPI00365F4992